MSGDTENKQGSRWHVATDGRRQKHRSSSLHAVGVC